MPSERRSTTSQHHPHDTDPPAEEFGVELDWPDETGQPPPGSAREPSPAAAGEPGDDDEAPDGGSDHATLRGEGDRGDEGDRSDGPAADAAEAGGQQAAGDTGAWAAPAAEDGWLDDDPAGLRVSGAAAPPGSAADTWSTSPAAARPPGPIQERVETLHGALAALAMRVDALVGATSTNRSAITERLNDHIDTVSRLARSQVADQAELQQATDRALGEVRRSLGLTEDGLRRLVERLDRLQGEMDAVRTDLRDLATAQARLPEVADSIARLEASIELVPVEEGAEPEELQVLRERIAQLTAERSTTEVELSEQVQALTAALSSLSDDGEETVEADGIHEALDRLDRGLSELTTGLAEGVAPAELRAWMERVDADLAGLAARAGSPPAPAAAAPELSELRAALAELDAKVDALGAPPAAGALAELRKEMVVLRRRLPVRAKPVEVVLDAAQAEELADAVVARLRGLLEVVSDDDGAGR